MFERVKRLYKLSKLIATDGGFQFEKDLIRADEEQRAKQLIEDRMKQYQLQQILDDGTDRCSLCGTPVDVTGCESWDDIFERLIQHCLERDDHVKTDTEGWMLVEDTE